MLFQRRNSQAFGPSGDPSEEPTPEGEDQNNMSAENRRRSVLMDSSLKSFQKMLDSAGEFMREEIEKLPLRKYE